jgi:hypothetical protein
MIEVSLSELELLKPFHDERCTTSAIFREVSFRLIRGRLLLINCLGLPVNFSNHLLKFSHIGKGLEDPQRSA